MSADPADRTATLVPRDTPPAGTKLVAPVDAAPQADASGGETDAQLPIDDPDRYEQVGEHARGGLGRVVRAVDRRLGRTVAVKELLRHDEWHEARFVREALITARLEHPGIVPVHEAGRWPNGAPYYVMKLVEGRTLKELLAGKPLLRDRLALVPNVIALADAVGYAHSEGVIHRDLKPSNVIVGAFGETIVVDWGLARDRVRDVPEPNAELLVATGSGVSTVSGKVVGTPAYMAPEQARGELVDERADVYAIGAVLYELLAGKAPHADATPEAVLQNVIAGPPAALVAVAPAAPRELVGIVAKAMARSPGDRYANATALAEDLRRFQTGQLVSAHAYTTWQRVRKRMAQHRGVVAVAAASAIALGAVGVASFRRVVAERDIARGERARAEVARGVVEDRERELVLVQAETSLRKDPTAALAWLKRNPASERDVPEVVDVIDEAIALGSARHVFRLGDWVFDAAFTPDGKTIVAAARDRAIRTFDVATGAVRVIGHAPSPTEALAIAPDGTTAITGGTLGEVISWPLAGGSPRTLVERGPAVLALRFDEHCQRLAVERETGPAQIVDLASGAIEQVGPDNAVRVAIAARDFTKRAALVSANQIAVLGEGPPRVVAQTERAIEFVAVAPAGDAIVVHDGRVLWSVPFGGGPLTKLAEFPAKLNSVSWSHELATIAVVGHHSDALLVHLAPHAAPTVEVLRGHTDEIYSAVFTHDDQSLLTASDDATARVWDVNDGSSIELRGHDDDVYRARFSPDERLAVTASLDGSLRVWPIAHGGARVMREGPAIVDLTVDGNHVLARTATSVARWDLATGTREQLFSWATASHGLGIGVPSPAGDQLLVPTGQFTLELRHAGDTAPPIALRGHHGFISHVEWSRDGRAVYSASFDGTLRRWNPATGEATVLVDGREPVRGFAVASDGRVAAQVGDSVVVIAADGHAEPLGSGPAWCSVMSQFDRVRDRLILQRCDHELVLVDGKRVVQLPTEGIATERIVVSPNGQRFAAALSDRTVRLWDADGRVLAILRGHSDLVMDVAFSPDGAQLATASYDRTVRIWDLASGRHRVLRGHAGAVDRVVWLGPTQLVTGADDGTLRTWDVPSTTLPTRTEIAERLDQATTARIDADNRATTAL